ncbi:SDR family NAD(P)-dependent oxidoreductase [Alcanivorax sp. DP30]|uniref:SDR family NAD(P)-dependent oxidoreductase n=1 Tax=Alcanivorax sp. DP30 TaxID=2606217 RepID=UPI001368DFCD|nr:SDR family NAD(P)-dependent oxidoreductase [Alcanivorax sp. DP30]MZR64418.1 SDR family NAD(P)-dependent oxidoreductase [Alcanivorax sp. DP30]
MTSSTAHPITRLITGASSGIGLALVQHWLKKDAAVIAVSRHACDSAALTALQQQGLPLDCRDVDITDPAQLETLASSLREEGQSIEQIINCAGVLHDQTTGLTPEKRLEEVNLQNLQQSFAMNTFAPILLARQLLPLMPRRQPGVFASVSARVGSIEDNHLGGWYSYRASKAAQNQLLRTLAIETRRRYPQLCVLSLHPGTTDTPLSEPFQRNVPEGKLFSPARSARQLADIIDNADENDHGRFIAWDGRDIPW